MKHLSLVDTLCDYKYIHVRFKLRNYVDFMSDVQ